MLLGLVFRIGLRDFFSFFRRETFTPHIRWAQRKDFVYLKVDIDGAVNPQVKLDSKSLSVAAVGANGRHYTIVMTFLNEVVPEVKCLIILVCSY